MMGRRGTLAWLSFSNGLPAYMQSDICIFKGDIGMALYIRDAEVDALAAELQKVTKARTKTEAVRRALQNELALARKAQPLRERLGRARALADAMGPSDADVVLKAFADEMWAGN
jgi:antitoxin VapB